MSFSNLLKRSSSNHPYSLAVNSISRALTVSRAFSASCRRAALYENADKATFSKTTAQVDRLTVVDFYADWCGPCKMLSPALIKLTAEPNKSTNGQPYDLVKVDIDSDEGQALAREYDVSAVPTVIAFRDNVVISQFRGALPEPSVKQWLDSLGKA